jgi:D-alanyl-D-alanine carboxypeptidase
LLTLALFTTGYAQTLDKAKLDRFFDRLAEKNTVVTLREIVDRAA